MDTTICCLVDPEGHVQIKDETVEHVWMARGGVDESRCDEYRFDLTSRQLRAHRHTANSDRAVRQYLDGYVGSPERLMVFAEQGLLSKQLLADLLDAQPRAGFLAACTALEKQYTEVCGQDPCLDEGCAAEGETCHQAVLRAGPEYQKACAVEWTRRFVDPRNRVAAWRN